MKYLLTAVALATAAVASGCATYDKPYYARYDGDRVVARANAAQNPTVVVADTEDNAMPYTQHSLFFKDRGLHFEDPSALTPKIVEPIPRG